MNFLLIISMIHIAINLGFAVFVLVKRIRSFTNISFALGLIALSCILFGDLMLTFGYSIEWKRCSMTGEIIFPVTWLLFSFRFGLSGENKFFYLYSSLSLILVIFTLFVIFLYPPSIFISHLNQITYLKPLGFYFYLTVFIITLAALIKLESTLFSSKGKTKWSLKYAILGVGGLLGIFVYYYSHSILYYTLDTNLLPFRNGASLIFIVLLIAAFVRHQFLDLNVFVGRRVVYPSVVLFVTGIYFIFLGLLGEGMYYLGDNLSRNLILFLVLAGTISISALLLSEIFKRKAKRFINDNFYANRYEYKQEWLRFTEKLSNAKSSQDIQIIVLHSMIETFGVKNAFYWSYDAPKKGFKCTCAVNDSTPDINIISEENAFIVHIKKGDIYDSYNSNWNFKDFQCNSSSSSKISIIIPIMTKNELASFIMLGESIAGFLYDHEDYDLMKTLSRQVSYAIYSTELSEFLAESRELEAMGKISSFVIHDLKNLTTSLSILVENAKSYINEPEFQKDMLTTISNTIGRMKKVIQKLSHFRESQRRQLNVFNIEEIVPHVLQKLSVPKDMKISFIKGALLPIKGDREEITKVLNNLLLNAIEAIEIRGEIIVHVTQIDNMACMKITDNGKGMSNNFLSRELFKPFRSSKKEGLGIGLFHCKSIVESHGGRIEVISKEGEGSTFTVYLPLEFH